MRPAPRVMAPRECNAKKRRQKEDIAATVETLNTN
jgi:hypothetical protein